MTSRLDDAIHAARESAAWTPDRSARVLAGALDKRRARERGRSVRRGMVALAFAGVLVVALFRSAAGREEPSAIGASHEEPAVAWASPSADAGYERD